MSAAASAVSSNPTPACPVLAAQKQFARPTLPATQSVGANLASFPNLIQSPAAGLSVSEIQTASRVTSVKTKGASKSQIPAIQVRAGQTPNAWSAGQAIPSADVCPRTSPSQTRSLDAVESANGIPTAGPTWSAATTSASPDPTPAYPAPAEGTQSATSTGRATLSAPASPASLRCPTRSLVASGFLRLELHPLILASPPHAGQTLSAMSINKETPFANASKASAPCRTQFQVVRESTRVGTTDHAGSTPIACPEDSWLNASAHPGTLATRM